MKRCKVIGISFILFSLMFVGTSYAAIDPATCVGLWFFDEGTGDTATDSSGNGNDGTLMNEPTWVDGKFGGALEFDGVDNYVEVADADSLKMTSEITVAFWFRTGKQMVEFGDRQVVVGKHYLEYEVGIYPAGAIHTYTSNGADSYDEGINCSIVEELSLDDWALDEWYHLAWTLNGNHEIVYVNGVNVGEFDKANNDTKPGTHTLEIGRRQGGSLPFTGAVDEVAIYNVALGEEDISFIMKGLATAVSPSGKLASTWGQIKK
jgi:hypothetical protein